MNGKNKCMERGIIMNEWTNGKWMRMLIKWMGGWNDGKNNE